MTSVVAAAGVFVLATLAPFETTAPLVRLPGQAVSNLEAALLVSLVAWGAALVWSRRVPLRDTPLATAWIAFVAAMAIAAAASPVRANAWHMTGRLAAAAAVYLLAVDGLASRRRLRIALALTLASGVVVALLAILEYLQVAPVLRLLRLFRPWVTSVGAQVRAGGPLQYPTIASMYLEIVFGIGVGLLLTAIDERRSAKASAERRIATLAVVVCFAALALVADAIVLTFTRAGLITMALTLALAAVVRWKFRGFDGGLAAITALTAVVVAIVASSRSAQTLWLRATSEGQEQWYRAEIDAPADLRFGTDQQQYVRVTATNTGRVPWDSTADPPILLSYHWLLPDAEHVVAYNGDRTPFDAVVPPDGTATVHALVRAPQRPGTYRLEWDLVQENRLWFSTEPDAPPSAATMAVVSGAPVAGALTTTMRPPRSVRPGRLVLWRAAARMIAAHPVVGVGPDNFRLLYGAYAGLPGADPRTHTNNMYLEVLVGGGVLAAAFFAWFLRDTLSLFSTICPGVGPRSDPKREIHAKGVGPGSDPGPTPIGVGIAAAGMAIAVHGTVDSFLSFAPTYVLFALTLGFAAAVARGVETPADAHRV